MTWRPCASATQDLANLAVWTGHEAARTLIIDAVWTGREAARTLIFDAGVDWA